MKTTFYQVSTPPSKEFAKSTFEGLEYPCVIIIGDDTLENRKFATALAFENGRKAVLDIDTISKELALHINCNLDSYQLGDLQKCIYSFLQDKELKKEKLNESTLNIGKSKNVFSAVSNGPYPR